MAQLFSPRANVHSRVIIVGVVVLVCGAGWATSTIYWSPYTTYVGVPLDQPMPFSHKHHVGDDGIDCRYCHASVEQTRFAGMPSTQVCMSCHSQLFNDSPLLAPLRDSLATGRPLRWIRIHDLPDFAFFDHGIHVSKGVACVSCHGRMDQMPLTWREHSLEMQWCLDCHRHAPDRVRPRERVFDLRWKDDRTPPERHALAVQYRLQSERRMTDSSTCHR